MQSLALDVDQIIAEAVRLYGGGKFHEAAEQLAAALRHAPDHAVALRLRGLSLVRIGEVSKALPLLARARRLTPTDPLVFLHYGVGLREAGRLARAAAMFRRAIGMLPKDPVPWINFSSTILCARPCESRARRGTSRPRHRSAIGRGVLHTRTSPNGARKTFLVRSRRFCEL